MKKFPPRVPPFKTLQAGLTAVGGEAGGEIGFFINSQHFLHSLNWRGSSIVRLHHASAGRSPHKGVRGTSRTLSLSKGSPGGPVNRYIKRPGRVILLYTVDPLQNSTVSQQEVFGSNMSLVYIRKWLFFTISASIRRIPCAAYPSYASA